MNSSFRALLAGASRAAIVLLQPSVGPLSAPSRGKKPGAIGRHLIRCEVSGPFFRQVGLRVLRDPHGKVHGTAIVTERYVTEGALHATKGWRRRNRTLDRRLHGV